MGWLERGAETVGVHRVDAAGAREVHAVGGEVGWGAAEELPSAAVGARLRGRGRGWWAGVCGGALVLVVGEEGGNGWSEGGGFLGGWHYFC